MPVTRQVDNVIVEGLVEHGVYPTRHEEIGCSVILRGDPRSIRANRSPSNAPTDAMAAPESESCAPRARVAPDKSSRT